MELQKPRIIKRVVRPTYAGTMKQHGNDFHTTAYTAYADADAISAVEAEDPLDLAGDVKIASGKAVQFPSVDVQIYPIAADTLRVCRIGATGTYRDWQCNVFTALTGFRMIGSPAYCRTKFNTGSAIEFQSYAGSTPWTVCATLENPANVPQFGISRAGDITMLDDKFIDLGNDTSGAAANATNRGKLRFVEGAGGARDRVYSCMKSDADAYSWVEIANGGA